MWPLSTLGTVVASIVAHLDTIALFTSVWAVLFASMRTVMQSKTVSKALDGVISSLDDVVSGKYRPSGYVVEIDGKPHRLTLDEEVDAYEHLLRRIGLIEGDGPADREEILKWRVIMNNKRFMKKVKRRIEQEKREEQAKAAAASGNVDGG